MNNKWYKVTFKTGFFWLGSARSPREARILAQAFQIDKGNDYRVNTVAGETQLEHSFYKSVLYRVKCRNMYETGTETLNGFVGVCRWIKILEEVK